MLREKFLAAADGFHSLGELLFVFVDNLDAGGLDFFILLLFVFLLFGRVLGRLDQLLCFLFFLLLLKAGFFLGGTTLPLHHLLAHIGSLQLELVLAELFNSLYVLKGGLKYGLLLAPGVCGLLTLLSRWLRHDSNLHVELNLVVAGQIA